MLALSLLGYLVAELFRGYVADSSPYVPGLSYSQFSMLMIVELCLCFLAWFLVVTGDYPRPWIFQVVPMEQYWFFDKVDDDDLAGFPVTLTSSAGYLMKCPVFID